MQVFTCKHEVFALSVTIVSHVKPYSALLVTPHCALCRKDVQKRLCMLVCRFCIIRKYGTGTGGGVTCKVLCTGWLLGLAGKGYD